MKKERKMKNNEQGKEGKGNRREIKGRERRGGKGKGIRLKKRQTDIDKQIKALTDKQETGQNKVSLQFSNTCWIGLQGK